MKTLILKTFLVALMLCSLIGKSNDAIKIAEIKGKETNFTVNTDLVIKAINSTYFESNEYTTEKVIIYKDENGQYFLIGVAVGKEHTLKMVFDLDLKNNTLYLLPNWCRQCEIDNGCNKCITDGSKCACDESSQPGQGSCSWKNVRCGSGSGTERTLNTRLEYLIKNTRSVLED